MQILTIVMLLHNIVNCTNLITSKPILSGVLPNGVYGQLLSICSSIALVAILSPFLHPQYEISLPCFSLYFFIPTFSGLPLNVKSSLVSVGSIYIMNFLPSYTQIPSNYASSPFSDEEVWLHLPFNMECTFFCPLLQLHMLKILHFDWCNVTKVPLSLSRK